jgi:hypothetical protein
MIPGSEDPETTAVPTAALQGFAIQNKVLNCKTAPAQLAPIDWSWLWDLNPQPPVYKTGALPIELSQPARFSDLELNQVTANRNFNL